MSYYMQGDYYSAGDPGIWDLVKGVGKTIAGAAGGLVTGGVTGAITGAIGANRPTAPQLGSPSIAPTFPGTGGSQMGGSVQVVSPFGGSVTIQGQRAVGPMLPSGEKGGKTLRYTKDGKLTDRKRPTMDPGNVKALRRADRRIDRFVGVARKALKHTNYKVVSKSAGTRGRTRGVSVSRNVSIGD